MSVGRVIKVKPQQTQRVTKRMKDLYERILPL